MFYSTIIESMDTDQKRASIHAALGDVNRLRIVDRLIAGDASSSELATALEIPTNLLAHHLKVLSEAGLVRRRASEGDRRRSYLRLATEALDGLEPAPLNVPTRLVFICTANSARSHLAAALWRQASSLPALSAGTHPAQSIAPGAVAVAARHALLLPRSRPQHLADIVKEGDMIVTVCDRAHEELGHQAQLHWSVADPVWVGTDAAFDEAFDDLAARVSRLEPRFAAA